MVSFVASAVPGSEHEDVARKSKRTEVWWCFAEVQRRLAHEYWWAQQDRHPGLIQPPSMVPVPLKQIADTRSTSSLDEDRSQQKPINAAPANASKPPKDRCPQSEGHRDRRGPYPGPDNAARDTPKTMQLWRDVVRILQLSCLSTEALQLTTVHARCPSFPAVVRPTELQEYDCQALAKMLHL